MPAEVVEGRLLKPDSEHILYVMDCWYRAGGGKTEGAGTLTKKYHRTILPHGGIFAVLHIAEILDNQFNMLNLTRR